MDNYVIATLETFQVHYNVLVEDGQGEEEAKRKFDRGEYDGRLVMDNRDVEIISVELRS